MQSSTDPKCCLNYKKMYVVKHKVRVYDLDMVQISYIHIFQEQKRAAMKGRARVQSDGAVIRL